MLVTFNKKELTGFITTRKGEIKLGENVITIDTSIPLDEALNKSHAKFVILGIPEDIGVRMNKGIGGAHSAFIPAIKAFLNTQQNQFIDGKEILILGYLDYLKEVEKFDGDPIVGDQLVKTIDKAVSDIIQTIIESHKIPIIIGGGHNNAYGNLKGLSLAKKQAINVINFDAHTDLRRLEERHSGNGFSYALEEGFINKYFMFGLHENYTPQYIFDLINNNPNIDFNTFEELEVYRTISFNEELNKAGKFLSDKSLGIEIDLDCVQNFPSSAMTPSGFTPQQTRQFVYHFAKNNTSSYLHLCEGAPVIKNDPTTAAQVGKFISYLISDFIKGKMNYLN